MCRLEEYIIQTNHPEESIAAVLEAMGDRLEE